MNLKIALIEDNSSFINLIEHYFSLHLDIDLCLIAKSIPSLRVESKEKIDVVILDYDLPGRRGVDNIASIQKLWPGKPILMLSVHTDEKTIIQCLHAGASGYLVKAQFVNYLKEAVIEVYQGSSFLSPLAAQKIINCIRKEAPEKDIPHMINGVYLTDREYETASHLASGKSYQEAADAMFLSIETVRTYVQKLYRKVGVKSKIELMAKIEKSRGGLSASI